MVRRSWILKDNLLLLLYKPGIIHENILHAYPYLQINVTHPSSKASLCNRQKPLQKAIIVQNAENSWSWGIQPNGYIYNTTPELKAQEH